MAAGGDPTSTSNLLGFNNINNKYVKYARIFHNETYLQPANIPVGLLNYVANQIGNTFTEKIVLKIPTSGTSSLSERNIFFSLITKNGMADGTPTSINATLVERIDSSGAFAIIDKHTIADMTVRPAHDPNYIMQSPVCLQLPKTPRFFDYHLHFQNTGIGPAGTAEITLNFTPGFDMNTFQIVHARFSDENYYSSNQQGITVTKNQTANTILFSMNLTGNRGLSNLLVGTNDVANPYISRETMGDIYFRMKSTAMVPYFLTAQAEIRFYSQQTTNWEQPVYTNTAISAYSDCCNCEVMDCGKK